MANTMLIDAAHPEETRVVVVRGNRVEEFDFEAANRKQLRGNIYLAKVTRVEPSLQAAFVDYGGNRHGFLAFSEIHPDYYQIPVADRLALLEEEEAAVHDDDNGEPASQTEPEVDDSSDDVDAEDVSTVDEDDDGEELAETTDADADEQSAHDGAENGDDGGNDQVESVGAEDAMEAVPERGPRLRRQYKIQAVIRRRQFLLVQVVKEERGNKGAALTTYLSLAGRYSVLMPNTARGGGISRKITNPTDRKRLKKVAAELSVPEGMGVILRTAGASRTKAEIKRDFEYLLRLWENVRDLTLKSSAPSLVYEEGSLIKRSIRDLYNKDINEVLVAGDDSYREAKDFMRMLMPSHAKNVQPYKDSTPLFTRFGVEPQLDAMFSPQVTLRSGGYIVINQTEALVSIDVNSGRSTREHNIEDTALSTNVEAAEEVARQLRLRDLAGLIVIDFIDMEEKRNNRAVERKLKECLKSDRARIQVGRISHFGLLEMSRQRIRTGVLESSTELCPHCRGSGTVRSTESVALHVLRALEDHLMRGSSHHLLVRTRTEVALYILNQKRAHVADLEERFGLSVMIAADEMINGEHFLLERGGPIERRERVVETIAPDQVRLDDIVVDDSDDVDEEEDSGRRRRPRRRRRRRPSAEAETAEAQVQAEEPGEDSGDEDGEAEASDDSETGETKRRRRRGRRGGRRSRRGRGDGEVAGETGTDEDAVEDAEPQEGDPAVAGDENDAVIALPAAEVAETVSEADVTEPEAETVEDVTEAADGEKAVADDDAASDKATGDADDVDVAVDEGDEQVEDTTVIEVADAGEAQEAVAEVSEEPGEVADTPDTPPLESDEDEDGSKRSGWWQRGSFF